ncbi:MAG TPA: hypothetical protein VM163_02875 [bacterium]|nr:hypothetical protein [bacterium]
MTKKKLAIVVALVGLVALIALLVFAATTDECIKRIATGPMLKDLLGTTTFTVYAYHIMAENCDCNHDPGTLTLYWRYDTEIPWTTAGTMTAGLSEWCGVQEFSRQLSVSSGHTIDLKVVCSAHADCQATRLGFGVP